MLLYGKFLCKVFIFTETIFYYSKDQTSSPFFKHIESY